MASEGVMDGEPIPNRIGEQSISAFLPTNGRCDYPGMDYARQNIRHLMGGRSINQLADEAEIGQTWLQRFLNPDKPSGIQKANPEKLGAVARALGVSLNDLMFRDLAAASPQPTSQPGRPDFEKMAGAVTVLRQWLDLMDHPAEWVGDSVLLSIAWDVVAEFGEPVAPTNVIDLVKRFGQVYRAAGGIGGRRSVGGTGA